jgi:hypothetical protein
MTESHLRVFFCQFSSICDRRRWKGGFNKRAVLCQTQSSPFDDVNIETDSDEEENPSFYVILGKVYVEKSTG